MKTKFKTKRKEKNIWLYSHGRYSQTLLMIIEL